MIWTTTTYGTVIVDFTSSINTARAWARINAFLIDTRLGSRAFTAGGTFWSTLWWCTNEALKTWTNWMTVHLSALTVRTARRRMAWLFVAFWWRWSFYFCANADRITSISGNTHAIWWMILYATFSINCTEHREKLKICKKEKDFVSTIEKRIAHLRMYQCKDQHIYCLRKPSFDHILSLECIQVDSHYMGHRNNLEDRNMSQLHCVPYTQHSLHMD